MVLWRSPDRYGGNRGGVMQLELRVPIMSSDGVGSCGLWLNKQGWAGHCQLFASSRRLRHQQPPEGDGVSSRTAA